MKKYILVIMLSIVSLVSFNLANAQTATNENNPCKDKKNGDECTNRGGFRGTVSSPGRCDRENDNKNAQNNPLICKTNLTDWEDCVVVGDKCKSVGKEGKCVSKTTGSGRGTLTQIVCDTSGGSTGGGTCQDCGGSECNTGQVCATIGGNKQCLSDSGANNTCGDQKCNTGQVCVTIGGNKQCLANQCTGGGGAGNGGGGTPPSGNDTPTDATAPQTVGFINPIRFNSLTELIAGIINALLGILGAITVAVLVMSGFKYMISSNPGEVGQALDGIKNSIIGLAIIMGAFLITQYVISALAG